jgi:hypothetical protein
MFRGHIVSQQPQKVFIARKTLIFSLLIDGFDQTTGEMTDQHVIHSGPPLLDPNWSKTHGF